MAQLVHRTGAGLPNKPIFSSTRFCSSLAYGDLASLLSPDNPLLDISAQEYLTLQRFCHQNSLKYSHIAHTNISPQYLTQISHPPKVFSSEFFEKFSPHQNLTPICHQYISQIPHPPKVFSVFFDIFSHSSHQYLAPISHQYLTQISHPPKVLSSDFFEMFSPHQKMHLIIDQVCQREDSPSTLQEVCTFKSPFPPAKLPKKTVIKKFLDHPQPIQTLSTFTFLPSLITNLTIIPVLVIVILIILIILIISLPGTSTAHANTLYQPRDAAAPNPTFKTSYR